MNFVRKYTLFFGPFSSLYDFLTYGIMLFIFNASPAHAVSRPDLEYFKPDYAEALLRPKTDSVSILDIARYNPS